MRRGTATLLFWLLAACFGVFLLWPLGIVIGGGFFVEGRFTGRYLAEVFRNPIYVEGLVNSLKLAIGTTALSLGLAMPLAWLGHRYTFPGKQALAGLVLVPMVLPPFVGAIGLQQILGQYGVLNVLLDLGPVDWLGRGRAAGVVLLQSLGLYPILYLNISAALANVDPAMEEAAENLGCRGWRKFVRITLPLIMPGVFAGGTIVFIWSFTELGAPLILNYTRCASVQIYDALKEIGSSPFPYALVCVVLTVSIVLYGISRLVLGRKAYAMQSKATVAARQRAVRGPAAFLVAAPFLLVVGIALLPHIGVVLTSLARPGSWYRSVLPQAFTAGNFVEALGHDMTIGSIRNSLVFSSVAVVFNLLFGLLIAFIVVRSDLRYRGVLDALSMVPLAVPGLVMAFGFLAVSSWLSNLPWVKGGAVWPHVFDVRVNPTLFLVVAYAVRRLPYMVRAAVAGLSQTPVALEEAAANVGAGPVTAMRRITMPLISANLIAGALLAFAFSMLEVSDSLMLAQQMDFYPITKTIYELFQLIGTGPYIAAALGVWAMLFLCVSLIGSSLILGRKLGTLFRV